MPLLDRTGFITDPFSRDPATAGHPLLPLETLSEALPRFPGGSPIGVEIAATTALSALESHFDRLALIAIQMPAFADGRAFSLARRLRRAGFGGTLRITGPLIADQFAYALALGVDQIELPEASAARQPADQWLQAAQSITFGYQRGMARSSSILEQRRACRSLSDAL